jgi:hypothetical protein
VPLRSRWTALWVVRSSAARRLWHEHLPSTHWHDLVARRGPGQTAKRDDRPQLWVKPWAANATIKILEAVMTVMAGADGSVFAE